MHCDLSRPHPYGEIFFDHNHQGWTGNRVIADKLYQQLFIKKQEDSLRVEYKGKANEHAIAKTSIDLIKYLIYKKSSEICEVGELKDYVNHIKKMKVSINGKIGSVAVNCNPLTAGHLHLLEYASKQVDHLYIFVIEEDLSFFPFKARLRLVREGTTHLSNVTVLRGGRYICTQFTYPEYYSKEEVPQAVADASMEAWFFCEYIANALSITVIFLGDEPICRVTKQYNKKMKEILPKYGIKVNVIPRISKEGSIISASGVRKLLSYGDFDKIKKIVPECTYRYLLITHGNHKDPRFDKKAQAVNLD